MHLQNDRIYLRPVEVLDAQLFLKNTQNEEIRYMTGTKETFSLEQVQQHIQHVKEDPSRYDFAIGLNATDQTIGELSILDIDKEDRKAVFRIALNTMELTGKGFGTEAIQLVLKFVFDKLKLNRLQLDVLSHNERGIRAYEKAGFKKEGVLREAFNYKGVFSDEIIMAILQKEYRESKA